MRADKLMIFAQLYSEQSYCKRKQVGCVITRRSRIISSGYNGTLEGLPNDCEDTNNKTKDSVVHAEFNAIMFAAKQGLSLKGTQLVITLSPCMECAKLIINSGIQNVVYRDEYRDPSGIKFLRKAGIKIEQLKDI